MLIIAYHQSKPHYNEELFPISDSIILNVLYGVPTYFKYAAIQSDAIMKQRWARYCKDNYYAKGIEFDEVIKILADILK